MFDMCNEKEFEVIRNLIKNPLKGTTWSVLACDSVQQKKTKHKDEVVLLASVQRLIMIVLPRKVLSKLTRPQYIIASKVLQAGMLMIVKQHLKGALLTSHS